MREIFSSKKRGDSLAAEHVNRIGLVSRRTSSGSTGSYRNIQHTGSLDLSSNPPYHVQDMVIVTKVVNAAEKIYEVRTRYYDHQLGDWQTNMNAGPFFMDGNDIGLEFEEGDKADAFWHSQRSMYVPLGSFVSGLKSAGLKCARICECAKWFLGGIDPVSDAEAVVRGEESDTCCVYRGQMKSFVDVSDPCEPIIAGEPIWILTDCQIESVEAYGLVRLVQRDIKIKWRPGSNVPLSEVNEDLFPTVTETLDLYEWCCWTPPVTSILKGLIVQFGTWEIGLTGPIRTLPIFPAPHEGNEALAGKQTVFNELGQVVRVATVHAWWGVSLVNIPQGSTIVSARFEFVPETQIADDSENDPSGINRVWVRFEDSGNALQPQTIEDIESRVLTAATTEFEATYDQYKGGLTTPPGDVVTIDVTQQLQHVVNRDDWAADRLLVVFQDNNSDSNATNGWYGNYQPYPSTFVQGQFSPGGSLRLIYELG